MAREEAAADQHQIKAHVEHGECGARGEEGFGGAYDPPALSRSQRALEPQTQDPHPARTPRLRRSSTAFHATHRSAWRSPRHARDWLNSLLYDHAEPIALRPCSSITPLDLLAILQPLAQRSPVTAGRVRQRIETVLAYAAVMEGRAQANPARWYGHLSAVLPRRPRPHHLRTLRWDAVPAFMRRLDLNSPVDRAIRWTVLTVARRSETIQATRDQVDAHGRVWHIPGAATKTGEERRVPLHPAVVPWLTQGRLHPIGISAMLERLRDLECAGCLHGMRSAFVDWARDCTKASRELIEAALGHTAGPAAWRAYARSDLLGRRDPLMMAWGDFVLGKETAP